MFDLEIAILSMFLLFCNNCQLGTPLDISISSDMFPRQSEETEPHSLNQYDFCGASESTAHANQMVPPLSFPQSATKAEHSLGTAPKPMEGS